MKPFEYQNEAELIEYAKEAEGKYLFEIDKENMLENTNVKGKVGHIIEKSYFGYDINSNAEPDFADVGIELKATGFTRMKSGKLKAKERLVLNIINYTKEAEKEFYTSSYWTKNARILLFFYEYLKNADGKMDARNTQIAKVDLFEFPAEDLDIVKQDWQIIHNKILNGEAHLISEGDTLILGACTKGANASSMREQPFSPVLAKQRAYSIKQGYMSTLVRKLITEEHLVSISSSKEIAEKSIEEVLAEKFSPYYGMTDKEIAAQEGITLSSGKARVANLISAMLAIKGTDLSKIEEFEKYNIKFKTITLREDGQPKEHMSFENIDFDEYATVPFEESSLREKFEETKWLFIVFQKNEADENVFKSIRLWNMPEAVIENELKAFYQETQRVLNEGVILEETKRGIKNNLPGAKDNPVCHLRPKGRNASDKVKLPDGQMITKQCFWLDKKYIVKLLAST
ncbi:Sau3AI family type II restriction endonuclease [Macrococcus brunensis]|uniref:Sau3AI family type II restriction endonuclease n=1 Tax=Macrococcus brunensis TaxID=198483 RepID=UPI001EF0CF38|nr:Sau3AI family type II restriction endonuclease [Macrococcus brunensis]ULG71395.1 restriction endonuclease [Macrococcus brunensis]